MDEMMKSSPICLLSKASKIKSLLWHRRLSHLNFGTINQLAKQGLVKGLPTLKYTNDHLCSACQKEKNKKESHPHKPEPSTNEKLQMLHMDLYGPIRVASINRKKYILVIVDYHSQFTWVKFLRTNFFKASSRPELQRLIFGHISLGLVQNQAASTSAKPPTKNDWDWLFQLMLDEYFKPLSVVSTTISAATLLPPDTTGASSSTSIDQDAPSPITSSAESSSRIVDTSNMHTFQQPQINTRRWKKDHSLVTIIVKEEPKNYKESMKESIWIEVMQDEIHEFEQLEVWELVPRPTKVMIINLKWIFKVKLDEYGGVLKNKARLVAKEHGSIPDGHEGCFSRMHSQRRSIRHPRGIFINQSKYALEMLKKFGLDQCDPVDIPMMEMSKLDKDINGTLVDPTRYRGLVSSLMQGRSCCAQILWMRSQLTDYGFDYNKIPLYCDSQSTIALSCNTVQHPRTKHIAVRYHFIKKKVKNEIVELYFVKTTYQLEDIFTKALARERFKFLVKCLGM
ncbi:retrovirus-related pol polyprotein from transposon TNT 1-94 [Tanacetum coccineum]